MSRCRSCTAEVFWARTASGKLIPIDAEPVDGGNVHVVTRRADGTPATIRVATQDELGIHPDKSTYVSHFATCPSANEHRSKR